MPGKFNDIADALSRFQMARFRLAAPMAEEAMTPLPSLPQDSFLFLLFFFFILFLYTKCCIVHLANITMAHLCTLLLIMSIKI